MSSRSTSRSRSGTRVRRRRVHSDDSDGRVEPPMAGHSDLDQSVLSLTRRAVGFAWRTRAVREFSPPLRDHEALSSGVITSKPTAPIWLPRFDTMEGHFLGAVPLWIPTVACLLLAAIPQRRWRDADSHCPECGYDLRASMSGRCPECGTITASDCPFVHTVFTHDARRCDKGESPVRKRRVSVRLAM